MNPLELLNNPVPYEGPIEVYFERKENEELAAHIDTENLYGEYTDWADLPSYLEVFANADIMKNYGTGVPWTKDQTAARVKSWVERWQKKQNPFTAFAFRKNDTDEFVSHVVAGGSEEKRKSELAYLTSKVFWKKGWTKEAATAVVKEYLPCIIKQGYQINHEPVEEVILTARPMENPGSVRIAVDLGMQKYAEGEKFGSFRWFFRLPIVG